MTDRCGKQAMNWRPLYGLFVGLILLACFGCGKKQESGEQAPMRDINVVMTEYAAELMSIPGVTGVAIGELTDKTPCIKVLILENTEEITRNLPKELEGYPVDIMVTGVIRPMDGR